MGGVGEVFANIGEIFVGAHVFCGCLINFAAAKRCATDDFLPMGSYEDNLIRKVSLLGGRKPSHVFLFLARLSCTISVIIHEQSVEVVRLRP